jgi:hypothetical protein
MSEPRDERSIFNEALALPSQERQAFVEQACGADATLRARVEELLAANEKAEGSSKRHQQIWPTSPSASTTAPALDRPGDVIGPYRLLEQIGEAAWVWSSWPSRPAPCAAAWR